MRSSHNFYIVRVSRLVKGRMMNYEGDVVSIDGKSIQNFILTTHLKGCTWQDTIKMDPREIGYGLDSSGSGQRLSTSFYENCNTPGFMGMGLY
jgi:hypothetical protein